MSEAALFRVFLFIIIIILLLLTSGRRAALHAG